jgi:hypothetical protein
MDTMVTASAILHSTLPVSGLERKFFFSDRSLLTFVPTPFSLREIAFHGAQSLRKQGPWLDRLTH